MPVFNYRCEICNEGRRKLLTPEKAKETQTCATCGAVLIRDVKPPSSQVVEVLDNGSMTKRLERLADAERLFRERAKAGSGS